MKITGAGAGEQCRTMFGLPHNSVAVSAVLMHIPLPHPACAAWCRSYRYRVPFIVLPSCMFLRSLIGGAACGYGTSA